MVWPGTKLRYYEGNFKCGEIDGENIKLYGGQKHCVFEGTIRAGLKEGQCTISDQQGNTTYKGLFIDGLEEGKNLKLKGYDGKLKFEGSRVNGKCDGRCKTYVAGIIDHDANYKLGVLDGNEKWFHSDGRIKSEVKWVKGKKQGF